MIQHSLVSTDLASCQCGNNRATQCKCASTPRAPYSMAKPNDSVKTSEPLSVAQGTSCLTDHTMNAV